MRTPCLIIFVQPQFPLHLQQIRGQGIVDDQRRDKEILRIVHTKPHHLLDQPRLHPHYIIIQFKIYGVRLHTSLIERIDALVSVHHPIGLPHQIDHRILSGYTFKKLYIRPVMRIDPDIVSVYDTTRHNVRNQILHIATTACRGVDYYLIILIHKSSFIKNV